MAAPRLMLQRLTWRRVLPARGNENLQSLSVLEFCCLSFVIPLSCLFKEERGQRQKQLLEDVIRLPFNKPGRGRADVSATPRIFRDAFNSAGVY